MKDEEVDFEELDFGGVRETEEKIRFVDDNLWTKVQTSGKKISFAKDVLALYRYMKDPLIGWGRKAVVVSALIYFITPIDAIPDFVPVFGYLDDLGVLSALLKFLGTELVPYYDISFRS